MKNKLLFIPAALLLFSCSDNPMETVADQSLKSAVMEINNSFLNVTDSLDKIENLTHYQYKELTSWGGIETWYNDNEIVKIRATERGENGFIRTTHFYENSSNFKSVQIIRTPNIKEFEEAYGELNEINSDKMTFTDDTNETVTHYSVLDSFDLKMIKEASELMIFVSNENKLVP